MEQQGANLSGLPERAAPEYYEIVQLITWELQSKFSKEDETSKKKKLRENWIAYLKILSSYQDHALQHLIMLL